MRARWLGPALAVITSGSARAQQMGLAPVTEGERLNTGVTVDTAGQFYDVRSPSGAPILMRRRVLTTLSVHGTRLWRDDADKQVPEITFRARMRYDADYGAFGAEVTPEDTQRFVPGLSRGPVDLMYGYIEGRRFLNGWLGFRLGRQYVVDGLGWWSFDGGLVRLTAPSWLVVEGLAGLEVRGGLPFSTPRFERDGAWRGDRTGYDALVYPSFQESNIAPAYGAAIEAAGIPWLSGRVSYRRVENTGAANTVPFDTGARPTFVYDASRVSQERVGYAAEATAATLGSARTGLAYDLYNARVTSIYGSLDAFANKRLTLGADYDYFRPTFDADTIWNFFASYPSHEMGARAAFVASDHVDVAGGALSRAFVDRGARGEAGTHVTFDHGAHAAFRYHVGEGQVGLRGRATFGPEGGSRGADVHAERVVETRWILGGRVSAWQWSDSLRPEREAVSAGYMTSLGFRFAERSRASVEFDHYINRIAGHRLRLMIWLTVAVTR